MSESSEKGRSLEDSVTSILKKKLGARVQRDGKSGAGSHQKMDIKDYFGDTRLAVECKNQAVIAIKKWFKQAAAGAPMRTIPTVVFKADDEVLATLRFADLVDLLAEAQQDQAQIKHLLEPIVKTAEGAPVDVSGLKPSASRSSWSECRGGNIVSPGEKKCLVKGCPTCHPKKVKGKK